MKDNIIRIINDNQEKDEIYANAKRYIDYCAIEDLVSLVEANRGTIKEQRHLSTLIGTVKKFEDESILSYTMVRPIILKYGVRSDNYVYAKDKQAGIRPSMSGYMTEEEISANANILNDLAITACRNAYETCVEMEEAREQ